MAVLADGGFGVAVDVEGVRDLSPALFPVPDPQPDRRLRPGRRPGRGLGHADLAMARQWKSSVEKQRKCRPSVMMLLSPYLLQTASCLVREGVCAGSSGREQREAGADLTPRSATVVGQQEGATFMEV